MKHVYVVTHGAKHTGANPGMTKEGFAQIAGLWNLIPVNPSVVVIGTGYRHLDVAFALGLIGSEDMLMQIVSDRFPLRFTPTVGGPDSLEGDQIVLADGTKVPRGLYTGTEDGADAMLKLVISLPNDAVICAGRPSMILLGKKDAKSAAVYRVTFGVGDWQHIVIDEVIAHGVSETGSV